MTCRTHLFIVLSCVAVKFALLHLVQKHHLQER